MQQLFKLLVVFFIGLGVLTLCSKSQLKPEYNVRVLKYTLDNSDNVLTFALGDNFYIAYDTIQCGLYKVWRGGLAANDSSISAVGELFYENYLLNSDIKLIDTSGRGYSPAVKFMGFSIKENSICICYEVTNEDKKFIIEETIKGESENHTCKLLRIYSFNKQPENTQIGIYIPNSSIRKPLTITARNGEVASGMDKLLLPESSKSQFTLIFNE
ncbi:hypothetical protein NF867_03115 [Solitalea sp. MAHUQ-68]|uniref:Uncharacterized protein n=1 Tax=Solitalea agri TaxID=2953739 RepID=A0A9X2JCJ0_9SPHI|nr:hypothetical protein [Solitalea agri]MCO4291850.1 hypothetical protein [Solitalea agri]